MSEDITNTDLVYTGLDRMMKEHIGTIIRTPEDEDERVRFSPHRYPEEHKTVVQAAIWTRHNRPGGSSKYRTFICRGLDSGNDNISIVNGGTYADTYDEAMEWIADRSAEYGGERINWLDLPRVVVSNDELEEKGRQFTQK